MSVCPWALPRGPLRESVWFSSKNMRGENQNILKQVKKHRCVLGAVAWVTSRVCQLFPRALALTVSWPAEVCGMMKIAWELEVAGRCSC